MSVTSTAYDEIVDLFACGSSACEVVQFRPSFAAQQRARYLLQRNRSGEITASESEELERLGQLEHLMQLVKARARQYSQSES